VDNLQQSEKFRFWNSGFYLHKTNRLRFTVWTGGAARLFPLSISSPTLREDHGDLCCTDCEVSAGGLPERSSMSARASRSLICSFVRIGSGRTVVPTIECRTELPCSTQRHQMAVPLGLLRERTIDRHQRKIIHFLPRQRFSNRKSGVPASRELLLQPTTIAGILAWSSVVGQRLLGRGNP
jgi:hypothetical protein